MKRGEKFVPIPCPYCGLGRLPVPDGTYKWAEVCPGSHSGQKVWYFPEEELEDEGRWGALEHLMGEEAMGMELAGQVFAVLTNRGDWVEEEGWVFVRLPQLPKVSELVLGEKEVR